MVLWRGTTASATWGVRAGAAGALRQLIAKKVGFSGNGQWLRLSGTKDDKLMQVAEQLGANVVTGTGEGRWTAVSARLLYGSIDG